MWVHDFGDKEKKIKLLATNLEELLFDWQEETKRCY